MNNRKWFCSPTGSCLSLPQDGAARRGASIFVVVVDDVVVVVVVVDIDEATPVYWGLLYSSGLCVLIFMYQPIRQPIATRLTVLNIDSRSCFGDFSTHRFLS